MLKICLTLLAVALVVCAAKDPEKTNEVDGEKLIQQNPALRRALLRALEDLESEYAEEESTTEHGTDDKDEILEVGDDADVKKKTQENEVEKVPAVQYHSFVVDGQKAFDINNVLEYDVEKKKLNDINPVSSEVIETKETKNANSITLARSIQSKIVADNSINDKPQTTTTVAPTTRATTTATTTTTTAKPKPIHNEDGENIEQIENHEVQVFQAPLVAAFTVHQDSEGLPKKVVPIYKGAVRKPILPAQPVSRMQLNPPKVVLDQTVLQQQAAYRQQLLLQQQLEQKQKLLEEQLQQLRSQQRQQEELLKQQQFAQQQQQFQQNRFFEEQRFRTQVGPRFQPKNVFPASVTFQQSISAEAPPSIEQHLPQKEAVDFLVHLRTGQRTPFPLQQTAPIAPNVNLEAPHDKPTPNFLVKPFNSGPVRVFRQDSGTGNFGFNTNEVFNRNNRFNNNFNKRFPPNQRPNLFRHNDELKSLLFQSGITHGGRSQEDLSIISKVLSLNHGIPQRDLFLDNRNILFEESRRLETKLKPNGNS